MRKSLTAAALALGLSVLAGYSIADDAKSEKITGVLPLVFGLGSGGALYQPLAAGVIGGSVSALLVTFFLLPTAYAVLERWTSRDVAPMGAPVLEPHRSAVP